jgi:hypothetical protein
MKSIAMTLMFAAACAGRPAQRTDAGQRRARKFHAGAGRGSAKALQQRGGGPYYDFVLARGVHFGMDLQYVNPAQGQNKNALIAGVRLRIRF